MVYQIYFSSAGVPSVSLTPVWLTLQDAITNLSVSQPAITAIGGGWYKFSVNPVNPLVGVIDGGVSLANADRYKSVQVPVGAATAFGSVAVTLATSDPVRSLPIPDVEVVILNQDETLLVNSTLTNSMGQLVAQLNPGTYVVRLRKDGYNFSTPQTLVVVGPTSESTTYNGTQVGDVAADFRAVVVPNNPNTLAEV